MQTVLGAPRRCQCLTAVLHMEGCIVCHVEGGLSSLAGAAGMRPALHILVRHTMLCSLSRCLSRCLCPAVQASGTHRQTSQGWWRCRHPQSPSPACPPSNPAGRAPQAATAAMAAAAQAAPQTAAAAARPLLGRRSAMAAAAAAAAAASSSSGLSRTSGILSPTTPRTHRPCSGPAALPPQRDRASAGHPRRRLSA